MLRLVDSRLKITIAAAACLVVAACGSGGSGGSSPSPSNTIEVPTATYSPPADNEVTPPEALTLGAIEPDEGIAPVLAFIRTATTSIDISIYRIDSTFTPLTDALVEMKDKGVTVRISMSRQLVGQPNPPEGNSQQLAEQQAFQKLGLQAELSRPEFHYGHEKAIILDAGTPKARAMIADWNLQASYFEGTDYGPVAARGTSVIDTDPQDVATIAAYFNANWPPYNAYPTSHRASLVWSPSGDIYSPVGNSVAVLTDFINSAQTSLDIYAEYIQDDAFLLTYALERAQSGVKVRFIANSDGQDAAMIQRIRDAGAQIVFDPRNVMDPSAVMFVHSKTMIADLGTPEQKAFVGSQNTFINESPEAILELGIIVKTTDIVKRLGELFTADWASAASEPAPPPSSSAAQSSSTQSSSMSSSSSSAK